MKHVKKYYLIEPTRYKQLIAAADCKHEPASTTTTDNSKSAALVHPNVKQVNKINKEMSEIIDDKSQSDYDKMQQYASKLDSYIRNVRLALTQSTKDSIIGTEQKSVDEKLANNELNNYKSTDQLILTVPKTYQSKAAELLNFMTQNGMGWDENGLVKVSGKTITGSNITQLVHDAVRQKKPTSQPAVYQTFKDALNSRGKKIQSYERLLGTASNKSTSLIPTRKRKATELVENNRLPWDELNV